MANYSVEINGIHVDATYSDEVVERLFLPLLKELSAKRKGKENSCDARSTSGSGEEHACKLS